MTTSTAPVGVIGCGLMGSGIAEVLARAGRTVRVHEVSEDAAAAGRRRIAQSLDRALRGGRLTEQERDAVLSRIDVACDLEALADVELAIEAASEDEGIKVALFARLDDVITSPHAVLASNTSSIPIMKLGTATQRPENVVGVHFFNPVPVLPLVEIVPSLLTGQATLMAVENLVQNELGKTVIRSQDRAGFVVNALLVPYLLSAMRMLESGFASAQDIDAGMVRGCAHPMGPLALSDLIGLDTVKAIAESMYAEFKEPLFSPPPILRRMVDAGLLGRKNGRGFFDHARSAA
jgi:3-hydroxybutyryl-CoA dehydrogenase